MGQRGPLLMDADDWAKEDCACNHRRHAHASGTGACSRTVQRTDYSHLPPAIYAAGADENPFALGWPTNWPDPADIPLVEKACGCRRFDYPEPSEPDYDPEDMR